MNRNMITSNPALYYSMGADGKIVYKNTKALASILGVDEATAKTIINNHASNTGK
jgi:hypothetical protein